MMETAKKDQNRQQLFKAALSLFAEYGYKKTTVEDVARALDMTKGNIYFYVKNKKDLYHQTINWALGRWQDHVGRAVARETGAADKFRAMGRSALAYIESDKAFRKLLAKDPEILTLDREKDRFPEANAVAMDIIRDILDQGIGEGIFRPADPESTVRYLFSIYMMFLIQAYVYLDLKDFKQMFDAALELNLGGLMRPPSQ